MRTLKRIDTFVKVVNYGSFSKVARELNISVVAVSKQISSLEADLKVQLLKRNTRSLALTEVGQVYYDKCKKILHELEETRVLINNFHSEPAGTLCILCGRFFYERFILPNLGKFNERYPKIILNIETKEGITHFERDDVDILIGTLKTEMSTLVRRKLFTSRYILCVSPKYLQKFSEPAVPNDLKGHLYITHSMRSSYDLLTFNNGEQIFLKPTLHLDDAHLMLETALQGLGIISLHSYIVDQSLKEGKLKEILPAYSNNIKKPIYLYYQKNSSYIEPKIRAFVDFMTNLKWNDA